MCGGRNEELTKRWILLYNKMNFLPEKLFVFYRGGFVHG